MIWLTWRQHRGEALAITALLSALGLLVLVTGLPMHEAYERDGVAACRLPAGAADQACSQILQTFEAQFAGLPSQFGSWLHLLPVFAALLIGVPLLSREYEYGTWQLAWTQAVPRTRWLTVKLALVLSAVTAAAVVFAAMMSWWIRPISPHQFTVETFNYSVLVFPSYVLLALAVGLFAGALIRRTIPAMAAALPAFLAVRMFVEFVLRPNYRTPLTVADSANASTNGWIVNEYVANPGDTTGVADIRIQYQPDERFWEFQLIETAIFTGLALILLAATYLLVSRVRR